VQERFAPVTERAKKALMELWLKVENRNAEDFVFPSKSYKKAWKSVLTKSGLTDIRLRDLRRDFRTRLSKAGMNDSLVQKIMGHSNLDTTFYYLEADSEAVRIAKTLLDNERAPVIESEEIN